MYACAYNYKYHQKKHVFMGCHWLQRWLRPSPKGILTHADSNVHRARGSVKSPSKKIEQCRIFLGVFSEKTINWPHSTYLYISFQWGCSSSRSIRNYPFSRFQRQPTPISGDPQKNVPANSGALFTADSASTTTLIRAY